jgi:ABC-type Fe3+ transport system substrate-binding protein
VQPEEGFLLWSDNMQVPVGASHAFSAEKFMDFVYRPEVQVATDLRPLTRRWGNGRSRTPSSGLIGA